MADNSNSDHNDTIRYRRAAIALNLTGLVLVGVLGGAGSVADAAPADGIASSTSFTFGDWPTGPPDQPVPPGPAVPPPPAPAPAPPKPGAPPAKPGTVGPHSYPGTPGWLLFWAAVTV